MVCEYARQVDAIMAARQTIATSAKNPLLCDKTYLGMGITFLSWLMLADHLRLEVVTSGHTHTLKLSLREGYSSSGATKSGHNALAYDVQTGFDRRFSHW